MSAPRAARPGDASRPRSVWTIGHSTLALPAFLERLQAHRIETVVDVRRHPVSRWHPHFTRARFAPALAEAGFGYVHLEALGGRREPAGTEENAGLGDPAFRGYADWMASPAFAAGLDELLGIVDGSRAVLLCAEADFRKCHRRLLADALVARGVEVLHVAGAEEPLPHEPTAGARVIAGRVTYPGGLPGLVGP